MGQSEIRDRPSRKERWHRSRFQTPQGHGFSYALDINMVMLAGVLCSQPSVSMARNGGKMYTWAKLRHIDQGHRMRGCVMRLRFEGDKARQAYDNLDQDDHIAVVGRIWMGEAASRARGKVYFNWIQVEEFSCSMPIQIDKDPDFVRVRVDELNAICEKAGVAGKELVVPERRRRRVYWEDTDPWEEPETLESPQNIETVDPYEETS